MRQGYHQSHAQGLQDERGEAAAPCPEFELQKPPAIDPNTRFKYSNHGYGLLGLVIEAVAKEPYRAWIKREIVDAAGLRETSPDAPIAVGALLAKGHTPQIHLGKRLVIPGDYTTESKARKTERT